MESGGLKHQIRVYSRQSITTQSGSDEIVFSEPYTTWAQINNRNGRMREDMALRFGDYTLELVVRIQHQVKQEDKIELVGETGSYVVVSVVPNRERGFNTLICMTSKS